MLFRIFYCFLGGEGEIPTDFGAPSFSTKVTLAPKVGKLPQKS